MTRRNLAWRSAGLAIFAVVCAMKLASGRDAGSYIGALGFGLALLGLVLLIEGKRVPAALRAERSRHPALAAAIRARHRRRIDDRNG